MVRRILTIFVCIMLLIAYTPLSTALTKEYNLEYDENGNLIKGINHYYEYNDFNQLERVKENNATGRIIAEYFYDHKGGRIKKIEYAEDGSNTTTYYIDKNFVRVVNSSGSYDTVFYYEGSALVARKDSNGEKYFYHPDHLGSTNLVTDEKGDVVEETHYLPFGEVLEGGDSRYLFTGQEKDKETSLNYYGARYYDSFSRHFTQPDTIIQNVYDPQSLNRYAYARNNPVKYVDPSGNIPLLAIPFIIGAISAGINLISQIVHGSSIFGGTINYGSAGKSFVAGTVAGFAGIGGGTVAASAVSGSSGIISSIAAGTSVSAASLMSAGVAGQATYNVMSGQPLTNNVYEVAVSGAKWGGAIGAITGGIMSVKSAGPKTIGNYKIEGKIREVKAMPLSKLTPSQDLGSTDYRNIFELQKSMSGKGFNLDRAVPYVKVGNDYVLAQGHHRTMSWGSLGHKTVPAFEITLDEARMFGRTPNGFMMEFNSFKYGSLESQAEYFSQWAP